MKIKEGIVITEIGGCYIALPVGERQLDLNAMITLSETGAFICKQLQTDKEIDEIVDALCNAYEIELNTAKKDTEAFLNSLAAARLLEQ